MTKIDEKRKSKQSGFTLIEVAIAIALLGIGLMTLIAITTRLMSDTQDEVNRTRASFMAQYLLEVKLADRFSQNNSTSSDEVGASSGSLYSHLQQIGFFENLENLAQYDYLRSWQYNLSVEPISLPLTTNSFEKYSLNISWGNQGGQEINLETIKKQKDLGQPGTSQSNPVAGGSSTDE